MSLFDLFKKKPEEPKEPYTREQFENKFANYPREIIEDWAKRTQPNPTTKSIGEQIDDFKRTYPNRIVVLVKIDEPDTFGLIAE